MTDDLRTEYTCWLCERDWPEDEGDLVYTTRGSEPVFVCDTCAGEYAGGVRIA